MELYIIYREDYSTIEIEATKSKILGVYCLYEDSKVETCRDHFNEISLALEPFRKLLGGLNVMIIDIDFYHHFHIDTGVYVKDCITQDQIDKLIDVIYGED